MYLEFNSVKKMMLIVALPNSATINIIFFTELNSRYIAPVDCGTHERVGSANPYDVGSGVCRRRSMEQGRKGPGCRGRNRPRDRFDVGSRATTADASAFSAA